MSRTALTTLTLALFLLVSYGCSQKEPVTENDASPNKIYTIENVPFIKQKDEFCGPASMASVMAYYGDTLSQEEIAEEVYTPALNGALISDMENFARDSGYDTTTENGSLELLKTRIDQGAPVILLVDKGKWRVSVPHYYVAYGYVNDGESFIIHTGFDEAVEIDSEKLDSEWNKMNRLMLVIDK